MSPQDQKGNTLGNLNEDISALALVQDSFKKLPSTESIDVPLFLENKKKDMRRPPVYTSRGDREREKAFLVIYIHLEVASVTRYDRLIVDSGIYISVGQDRWDR